MSFGESTPVLPHARMPVRGDRLYIDPASDASATADARARCRSVGAGVDAPLQGVAYAVGRADFTKFALSNAWKSGQHLQLLYLLCHLLRRHCESNNPAKGNRVRLINQCVHSIEWMKDKK